MGCGRRPGAGAYVAMQTDGNFVVYNGGSAKWSSNTSGFPGSDIVLQDDGNLVVYQGSRAIWDWGAGLLGGGGGGTSEGQAIVNKAASMAGEPYCWDGGGIGGPMHGDGNIDGATQCPGATVGFDCTGLTIYATGKSLAHDSAQAIDAVKDSVQRIYNQSELQPGDLVYFGGSFEDFDHVGVYAGGGMMWDADIAYWVYPDGVHERSLASVETELLSFVGAVRF